MGRWDSGEGGGYYTPDPGEWVYEDPTAGTGMGQGWRVTPGSDAVTLAPIPVAPADPLNPAERAYADWQAPFLSAPAFADPIEWLAGGAYGRYGTPEGYKYFVPQANDFRIGSGESRGAGQGYGFWEVPAADNSGYARIHPDAFQYGDPARWSGTLPSMTSLGAYALPSDTNYGYTFDWDVAPALQEHYRGQNAGMGDSLLRTFMEGPFTVLAPFLGGLLGPAIAAAAAGEAAAAGSAAAAGLSAADAAAMAGVGAMDLADIAAVTGSQGGMFSTLNDLSRTFNSNFLADFGVPDWATSAGKNFATNVLTGGDPKRAAISSLLPKGIQFAGDLQHMLPSMGDLPSFLGGSGVDEVGLSAYDLDETFADVPPADSDTLKRRLSLASEGTLAPMDMSGFSQPLMPPAVPEVDPTFGGQLMETAPGVYEQPAVGMLGSTLMPPAQPEPDPTFEGQLAETAPGIFEQSPLEPVPSVPRISDADAQRYASIAQKVYGLFEGGEDQVRQGAPRRSQREDGTEESFEEMTPEETEEYFDQVVEYLGLDTAAMAEAGLTPGTPEYLDYILQQIDAMIAQGFGDADPDSEDFSALLRTKTEQEVQSLARALYIRGQLGIFAGPGSYMDPFTEIMEDVAAPEGASFRPSVAAYHRGLARSAEEMSKLAPQERKRFLGGMLDREPDLFGAQAKRDAQALREALSQTPEDEMKKRRKGMFGEEAYFQSELERMGKPDLDRMLRLLMGQDTARQGAAVEELFGWNPEMI